MQLKDHACLMAEYNHWMNKKVLETCEQLSPEQISEDRGAFFGSILGTLNHLMVADTIWLKRFSSAFSAYHALAPIIDIPQPKALNEVLFANLVDLKNRREQLDQIFLAFTNAVKEDDLLKAFTYKSFKGMSFTKPCFSILMHVFNHQTHHRGQITTLLSQYGLDEGVTDLVAMVPDL